MLYLRAIHGLIDKDLRLELRGRETVGSVLVLAVLMLIVFHFALSEGLGDKPAVAVGAFWVALLFGAVLGQSRTFVAEREGGCLTALLLTPADRSAIYLGKVLVNLAFLGVVELLLVPFFLMLYDVPVPEQPGKALAVLFLASVGLTVVGTLVSSLGLNNRNRELLLPILLMPLLLPVLIGAVEGTASLLPNAEGEPVWTWLRLLIGYDVLFLAVSVMLFDFALGE
jgi:heme exporter protein B